MAVTSTQFLVDYPEFVPLHAEDSAYVDAVVARAERRIGGAWPTEIRDDIVKLQAAHMLAMSPMGRDARLSEPGQETAYEMDLKERKKGFAFSRSRVPDAQ